MLEGQAAVVITHRFLGWVRRSGGLRFGWGVVALLDAHHMAFNISPIPLHRLRRRNWRFFRSSLLSFRLRQNYPTPPPLHTPLPTIAFLKAIEAPPSIQDAESYRIEVGQLLPLSSFSPVHGAIAPRPHDR